MGGRKNPPHRGEEGKNLFQFQLVHGGDIEPAVNVNDFTGDTRGQVRAQEGCAVAHIFNGDGATDRGDRFAVRQHFTEIFNARSSQRTDRTGRDGVDANAFRTHGVSHIADVSFQRGFGQTHYVVVRDRALCAQVGERQQSRARVQHAAAGFGHRHEAVGADVVRDFEAVAGDNVNVVAV